MKGKSVKIKGRREKGEEETENSRSEMEKKVRQERKKGE